MKSSKGFTLVEIMTAMAVYGIFLSMLAGAFYALLTFGNRSQNVLIARERGQRVINYVDSKIRNAGLGLHALQSSEEIRKALDPLSKSGGSLHNSKEELKLPVAVTYKYQDTMGDDACKTSDVKKKYDALDTSIRKEKDKNIFIGNILTLLYAERETQTDIMKSDGKYAINLAIVPCNASGDLTTSQEIKNQKTETVKLLAKNLDQYNKTFSERFSDNEKTNKLPGARDEDIRNWAVLRGAGIPVRVKENSNYMRIDITPLFYGSSANQSFDIYAGDELLYLECETLFAENPREKDKEKGETVRNLKVQKPKGTKVNPEKWGDVDPFESGILEIYAELDTNKIEGTDKKKNILTLWVLSTGGRDTVVHERPKDWPLTARPTNWDDKSNKYKYEILYVSKASWKLNNLAENFTWN